MFGDDLAQYQTLMCMKKKMMQNEEICGDQVYSKHFVLFHAFR